MQQSRGVFIAKTLVILSVVPAMIFAFRSGPPPARTGAPGEGTCFASGCHASEGGQFFPDSTALQLEFSGGATYEPGMTKRLTMTNSDSAGVVYGFQLSARDSNNGQAGELRSIDATTQILTANGIQYIEHTAPVPSGVFMFDWVAPSTDIGPVTFYLASNAANNNFANTGDRIHTRSFTIQPAVSQPQPTIGQNGIVHSATLTVEPGLSKNTFGSIFGTNLVASTMDWGQSFSNGVAPTQLGGARVMVNGEPAFMAYTGKGSDFGLDFDQINFVYPEENSTGNVSITVETDAGTSAPATVQVQREAPGFFSFRFEPDRRKYVAAVQNDGSAFVGPSDLFSDFDPPPALPTRPAKPGDLVQLFGTGFGPTDPPFIGQIPTEVSSTVDQVTVSLGGTPATVEFAGLAFFVGLNVVVIRVPDVPNGEHELIAEVGGRQTQTGMVLTVQSAASSTPGEGDDGEYYP